MDPGERRQWLLFFVIAFVVLAAGYGLRAPWPADEPRFVLAARQMLDSGDWLFPHRGIELYADKPPLYFWMLAAARAALGSWRWSFLLPSLLAGLGVLWLVCDLGRRLWNPRAGLYAGMAVLCAVQFVYQFKRAQIDPSLVFFTTLALYGLCRHLLLGPHWRWFWTACFAAGIGVILKGVGFLPLLALLPYAAMRRLHWPGLPDLGTGNAWRWGVGALALLGAIALWLVPLLVAVHAEPTPEHRAYLHDLLFRQTLERYADPWHHQKPFWYFGQVALLFWAPFSLAFFWLWRDWRDAWRAREARVWLPLAWGLLVLVFFSFSPGKRDMYILPALPAFALAAAPILPAMGERRGFGWLLYAFVLALSTLLFGLGVDALRGDGHFVGNLLADRGADAAMHALGMLLAGIGAAGGVAALLLRPARALAATGLLLVALWCGYGFVACPLLDGSSSARNLMQAARTAAGVGTRIGLVDWKEQNLLQAIGPTTDFGFGETRAEQLRRAQAWLDAAPAQRRLLIPDSDNGADACVRLDDAHARRIGEANRRTWWLAGATAFVAACP
ncbi:MAG: glycosyltransferase family 39 protein [Proteobacteria bacterium]|nr:glycosyltransferase family 39 protein [Pseudomonadota bacterium]